MYNRSAADPKQKKETSDLQRFLSQLGGLSMSSRSATQVRDYVTSVWVDCPAYVLPINYKRMELADLLEDAVLQLEKNHGVSLIANAPAGIFDASHSTGLWRPSKYPKSIKVTRANEVYGALEHPYRPLRLGLGDTIPLVTHPVGSLSQRSRSFQEVFAGKSTAFVFESVRDIVGKWPILVHNKSMVNPVMSAAFEDKYNIRNERGLQSIISGLFRSLIVESVGARQPCCPNDDSIPSPLRLMKT
jgi:hypothetical protein